MAGGNPDRSSGELRRDASELRPPRRIGFKMRPWLSSRQSVRTDTCIIAASSLAVINIGSVPSGLSGECEPGDSTEAVMGHSCGCSTEVISRCALGRERDEQAEDHRDRSGWTASSGLRSGRVGRQSSRDVFLDVSSFARCEPGSGRGVFRVWVWPWCWFRSRFCLLEENALRRTVLVRAQGKGHQQLVSPSSGRGRSGSTMR